MNIWILKNFLMKNGQLKIDDALTKKFYEKKKEVKIGRKNHEQEEVITNLEKIYHSRE